MQLRCEFSDLKMADGADGCVAISCCCKRDQFKQIASVAGDGERRQLSLADQVIEITIQISLIACDAHDVDLVEQARQCGAGGLADVGQEISRHLGCEAMRIR